MKTQQILESFFHMGTLTLCLFLLTLLAQGGEGTHDNPPSCKLKKVFFRQRYIAHQIISLAELASWDDNDTSTRLLDPSMFEQVEEENCCYLLKELMGLCLEEMIHSYPPKFKQYMRDTFPFFRALKARLDDCPLMGDGSLVQRQIDIMKSKLTELAENRQIKTFSELDLLLTYTQKYCT